MRFTNREMAARLLAEELRRFNGQRPLVLGVPRGGVPMARVVADHLGCDFDVVLVQKLRMPGEPNLAMGAVDEAGQVFRFGARAAVSPELYADEVAEQVAEIRRRRQVYSAVRAPLAATGRTAIIVDDGLATGASMVAAIRSVRGQRPLRIVAAVPVAPTSALDLARAYADEVVCLNTPRLFFALRDFYDDFTPVADSDVVALLNVRQAGGTGAGG
ncbi:MAG: phosphoribosyltransferase [Vicinamibacterales bacterium]